MFVDRCYVINLSRNPDRLTDFFARLPADWPFPRPKRFSAVDGRLVRPPPWWRQGPGAWGCYRSHAWILEQCLNEQVNSVLILEDDALFCPDFSSLATQYVQHLPADWEMAYLGGQLLKAKSHPPRTVNDHVAAPYNVHRTHAYAVRGLAFMQQLYHHLCDFINWSDRHHIDHHYGVLHQRGTHKVYCPAAWLVGQADGRSVISGKTNAAHFWIQAAAPTPTEIPLAVILGLHGSGAAAVAALLRQLGLHLGNRLGHYYGHDPEIGGLDSLPLVQFCERVAPLLRRQLRWAPADLEQGLRRWAAACHREAQAEGKLAGGAYPQLGCLGSQLRSISGDLLKVVYVSRDVEVATAAFARRCPQRDVSEFVSYQAWLRDQQRAFLDTLPPEQTTTVAYDELLRRPRAIAEHLVGFLSLHPTNTQLDQAIAAARPTTV